MSSPPPRPMDRSSAAGAVALSVARLDSLPGGADGAPEPEHAANHAEAGRANELPRIGHLQQFHDELVTTRAADHRLPRTRERTLRRRARPPERPVAALSFPRQIQRG